MVSLKTKIITEGQFQFMHFTKNCIKWSVKRQSQSMNSNSPIAKAAVSWKLSHCSAHTSLKIWWIITHEH